MPQKEFSYVVAFAIASGFDFKEAKQAEREELANFVTSPGRDDESFEAWLARAGAEVRRQQPALAKLVKEFWHSNAAREMALREQILANKSMLTFTSPEGK